MTRSVKNAPTPKRKKTLSMHDNVPIWYDCCSCEAEPYWQSLADESEADRPKPREQGGKHHS